MTLPRLKPPTAVEINALPSNVRSYIHYLEANADPAGDQWRLMWLEETCQGLQKMVEELQHELGGRLRRRGILGSAKAAFTKLQPLWRLAARLAPGQRKMGAV